MWIRIRNTAWHRVRQIVVHHHKAERQEGVAKLTLTHLFFLFFLHLTYFFVVSQGQCKIAFTIFQRTLGEKFTFFEKKN